MRFSYYVVIDTIFIAFDYLQNAVKFFIVNAMETVEVTSRPRGRPRAFDRDGALDKAMRLFWAHGYEATSVAELSHAMGINPPSLYAAFGDKRQLFEESVEAYQAGPGCFAQEALESDLPARAAIEKLLMEAAARFTDKAYPPGCMVVLSAASCSEEAAEIRERLTARRNASAAAIHARINAAKLPAGFNADAFAGLVVSVFQGMSVRAFDGATREELEATVRQVMALWPSKS
jgi:TetR/AcrR family transcriptional regulator, copper-responsive repressor